MKIDERYRSDNVIDRRGGRRRGAVGGGIGIGTLLLLLLVGSCLGIDVRGLLGGAETVQTTQQTSSAGMDDEGRAFVEATLKVRSLVDCREPGDRSASVGDDDVRAACGFAHVERQLCLEFTNADFHVVTLLPQCDYIKSGELKK